MRGCLARIEELCCSRAKHRAGNKCLIVAEPLRRFVVLLPIDGAIVRHLFPARC